MGATRDYPTLSRTRMGKRGALGGGATEPNGRGARGEEGQERGWSAGLSGLARCRPPLGATYDATFRR
ncbi:hypothetical protein B0G71_7111 [Paraburkholderia sp. BL27I4N3]|nr:hypothetical protein B0G71_7111 [Paraburkholderia sp. BL27I4N3]RKR37941.1 hypothetical protein B0G82_6056 [Paraburkholderia sp. BL17N1]